jgi:hypothetical protein
MSDIDFDPDYKQGEWEHFTSILPTREEVVEAFDRFWNKCEIDRFVYDEEGKITDVIRTQKKRERPVKKEYWARSPYRKQ